MGFGFSQLSNLTLSAVSVKQAGEASGVNNTIRQVGSSFGSAVMGAVLLATLTSSVVTHINDNQNIPAQAKPAITKQVKDAGSNIEFANPDQNSNVPAPIASAVEDSIHHATVDGNKAAMSLAIIFSIATLIFSTLLPNIRNLETAQEATPSAH